MADTKISALTAATTPLDGTEVAPIVQSGVTKKVPVADLTAGRAVSAASLSATGTGFFGVVAGSNISGAQLRVLGPASGGGILYVDTNGSFAGTDTATIGMSVFQDTNLRYNSQIELQAVGNGNYSADFAIRTQNSGTYPNAVSEKFRFFAGGGFNIGTTVVNPGNGNLGFGVAGKGINFSANTGAAGRTSTTLNWYEEGTWTPVISAYSGTITTVGSVSGTYTRIGRLVTVMGSFAITTNGTGSVLLQVTGMPFAASGAVVTVYPGSGVCTTTGKSQTVQYDSIAAKIYIANYDNTYPGANSTAFVFSVSYEV